MSKKTGCDDPMDCPGIRVLATGSERRTTPHITITHGLDPLQQAVTDFAEAFGAPIGHLDEPCINEKRWRLRAALIDEELEEFHTACLSGSLVGAVDALADLMYVVMGGFVELGVEAGPILEEVHRSNMTKLQPDGTVKYRADGKILKGPNYEKPDIAGNLDAQRDYYSIPNVSDPDFDPGFK